MLKFAQIHNDSSKMEKILVHIF